MYDEMKFSEEKEIISILLIIVKLFFSCTIDTASGITHMKKKKFRLGNIFMLGILQVNL